MNTSPNHIWIQVVEWYIFPILLLYFFSLFTVLEIKPRASTELHPQPSILLLLTYFCIYIMVGFVDRI
jgi:hypothetical protein